MLKVPDITQARSYVWINPEDNYRIDDSFYWRLEEKAKAYRRANHYPIGGNWSEDFEANICRSSPGICREFVPPSPRQKIESIVRATARYARSGFKTRTAEEIEDLLSKHCRTCNFYGGESGFLKIACQKCGCSKLKLAMRSEHCPLGYW